MAKSGTSTLQRKAFKGSDEIVFLGRPSVTEEIEWAVRRICRADSLVYEEAPVRKVLEDYINAAPTDKPVVISYENFCLYESKDKGMVAERLKSLFPSARILFTLRRQEELLASWYLQRCGRYARHKHYIDFDRWLNLKLKAPNRSILDDLSYFEAISRYVELFGRESVEIMFFEDMKADPESYCKNVADFVGIGSEAFTALFLSGSENPTVSAYLIPFSRFVAPILPRRVVKPIAFWLVKRGGKPAAVDIGVHGREVVAEICAESNRHIQENFDLDLESRGYTLSPLNS